MGFLSDLFGTDVAERGALNMANLYSDIASQNLPRGIGQIWNIIGSSGLTPGQQRVQGAGQKQLLGGYQRSLADMLRSNTESGTGTSLMDQNARASAGRAYSQDLSGLTTQLMQMSEQEKKAMLQFLMQLSSGAGGHALQGYGTAGDLAMAPWRALGQPMSAIGEMGSGIADFMDLFRRPKGTV